MESKKLFELLNKNKFIATIWSDVLEIVSDQIDETKHKQDYLNLFLIYFTFVDDGNTTMSLDKDVLLTKWNKKLSEMSILLTDNGDFDEDEFNQIRVESLNCINSYLSDIKEENMPTLIGDGRIFNIESGYLYSNKYNSSRKGIYQSIQRLFIDYKSDEPDEEFDLSKCLSDKITLSGDKDKGQKAVVIKGKQKNLLVTGGPGTGKTTSVLFLLLSLLDNPSYNPDIYLVAPSGKASSRMKDSIITNLEYVKPEYSDTHKEVIEKVKNLDSYTIHRLLGLDYSTNRFIHNEGNRFNGNSIFVIDEASMIDISMFNALLKAIPDEARVFIMGDKNQLPSVECGAVFGDLLSYGPLKENNVVELDESKRFVKGSKIYNLAEAINGGSDLPILEEEWKECSDFTINEKVVKGEFPIYYYHMPFDTKTDKNLLNSIYRSWAEAFYKDLQAKSSNLDSTSPSEVFDQLHELTENSKILCAENKSIRGVNHVNEFIRNIVVDKSKKTSIAGFYAGQLMMINTNNKMLDLFNGDSGILVTFKDDPTLYFMVQKKSKLIDKDGKFEDDKIFKLGNYVFYPFRLITRDEIDMAYAITIHKSQGSDYKNILVMLPKTKGHPLLNRQIVYTAITRTKGNTYIVSTSELLEKAKNTPLVRDTNIFR